MGTLTPTRHFTHVHREPWLYTHPQPPRAFRSQMADLLKYSTRLEALKEFLNEKNLRKLTRLKSHMISFGENLELGHDYRAQISGR